MARKRQSIFAVLGVVFGVATFIVLLGFMTGVNDFLDDAVFKGNPDIVIRSAPVTDTRNTSSLKSVQPLRNTHVLKEYLRKQSNIRSVSEQIIVPGILLGNSQQLPVQVQGVIPDQERNMVALERRLIHGKGFDELEHGEGILLGVSLARQLGVAEGERVQLVLPSGKLLSLAVTGIFSFGISTIDNIRAYVHINTLRSVSGVNPVVSHLHIKLKDREDIDLKFALKEAFGGILVEDWKENNKTIVIGNKVRDVLTWSVSLALLLVAGFGIFNILNNTVIQKRKDIAVLKTLGYRSKDLNFIFLVKSLIIGSFGALLGSLLGLLISYLISITPLETTDFIIVETYPVNFQLKFYVFGIVFGVLTAGLAGYWPSRKASQLDPATVIRDL